MEPLQQPDVRATAVLHSPVLAWLDEMLWNWTCDECGALSWCEHVTGSGEPADVAVDGLAETLEVLRNLLGGHRSDVVVQAALGADPCRAAGCSCLECGKAWPCPTVQMVEKAAQPMLDRWADERGWRQLPRPSQSAVRPEEYLRPDGAVLCPYCDDDVTAGVVEWRQQVNAVFRYTWLLRDRIANSMLHASPAMDESFRDAEREGLRLAESHVQTQLNALLFSHHEHLAFVLAEREAGLIDRRILV